MREESKTTTSEPMLTSTTNDEVRDNFFRN